jgi:hypothetical protein
MARKLTRLEDKDPVEEYAVAFSVTGLATGETLSTATVTATTLRGTDASPGLVLNGSATINGATVLQNIRNGVDGVDYKLKLTVTTSTGRKLTPAVRLPVRTK